MFPRSFWLRRHVWMARAINDDSKLFTWCRYDDRFLSSTHRRDRGRRARACGDEGQMVVYDLPTFKKTTFICAFYSTTFIFSLFSYTYYCVSEVWVSVGVNGGYSLVGQFFFDFSYQPHTDADADINTDQYRHPRHDDSTVSLFVVHHFTFRSSVCSQANCAVLSALFSNTYRDTTTFIHSVTQTCQRFLEPYSYINVVVYCCWRRCCYCTY
jgi:hypothetical protein